METGRSETSVPSYVLHPSRPQSSYTLRTSAYGAPLPSGRRQFPEPPSLQFHCSPNWITLHVRHLQSTSLTPNSILNFILSQSPFPTTLLTPTSGNRSMSCQFCGVTLLDLSTYFPQPTLWHVSVQCPLQDVCSSVSTVRRLYVRTYNASGTRNTHRILRGYVPCPSLLPGYVPCSSLLPDKF